MVLAYWKEITVGHIWSSRPLDYESLGPSCEVAPSAYHHCSLARIMMSVRDTGGTRHFITTCSICHGPSKSTISPYLHSPSFTALSSTHWTQHNSPLASPSPHTHRILYNVSEACLQHWHGGPHGWYVHLCQI